MEGVAKPSTSHLGVQQDSIRLRIRRRDGQRGHESPTANKYDWLDYSWNWDDVDRAPKRRGSFFTGNVSHFYSTSGSKNIEPPPTMSRDAWTNILSGSRTGIGLSVTQGENRIFNGVRKALQDDISELRRDCRSKLANIKALCGEIVILEETMADRQGKLAIVSSLTAPIRRLPLELLTRIFRLTLPNQTLKDPDQTSCHQSPLVLCRVSKLWQNTVVNDPLMWSQISCRFLPEQSNYGFDGDPPDSEQNYDNISQEIQCFSDRSGVAPLTLRITDYSADARAPLPENRRQIAEKLRTLFARCRVLEFGTNRAWTKSILENLPSNTFSSLENLHLDLSWNPYSSRTQIFSNCPLRHYRLTTFTHADLTNISIPHTRLETFDLSMSIAPDVSPRDYIQSWRSFLCLCSCLHATSLELNSLPTAESRLEDSTISESLDVCTPSTYLTKLTLKFALDASISTLLRGMDFPALEFLHLADSAQAPVFSFTPEGTDLAETIEHDMPYITRLTTLCLHRMKIGSADLRTLLRLTPRLERLSVIETAQALVDVSAWVSRVTWIEESADLISFLTIDEHENEEEDFSPPLPCLRVLALYSGYRRLTEPMLPSAYANLVRSRCRWALKSPASTRSEFSSETGAHAGNACLPFKLIFTVEQPKTAAYETIKKAMEDEFQDLPRGVLQVDHALKLENPPLPDGF
ncbi:unnamed protein product [Cyclocybe aegerita]|uniref:F-box domain-containing protein n=1 Tax=Cyclocybe aegerita TaxID=1973307 RepID=A0A8S0WJM3_CYCAE|nr:unnamed protein product [Cyclocybe aegerita]